MGIDDVFLLEDGVRRRIDSANLVRSHAACGARITLLSGVGVRCRVYVWLPVCKRSETEKAENVKGKMSQTLLILHEKARIRTVFACRWRLESTL